MPATSASLNSLLFFSFLLRPLTELMKQTRWQYGPLSSLYYLDVYEQHALKSANNFLNTNIYSDLKTSGRQSYNLYLNFVHFFNTSDNKKSVGA